MNETDVQDQARAFVASVDSTNIQNDLSAYVKKAEAKLRKEELSDGESGFTVTKANGQHVITVNSLESEERQRFTVCHEIAHIVLKLPSLHDELPSWSYAKRDINEVTCDIFAAELLMPYKMWKDKVPKEEPSITVIEYMAAEFKTSFPAAASRYANLADIPCAFVTMERGMVRYAARSTSLRRALAWIPPKTPIPAGSVAHRLRAAGITHIETDEVAQDVWFENWEKGVDLYEMARHYHRFDTTVALLWFPEEDLPEVEVDRFGVRVVDHSGLQELTGELPWPGNKKRR
ncbi:ImmA/IrrE family metallo-endopeptidase [Undibacterium arcticum]|uniref:ImmA/IrrE family metallo-endopeptidase n=1 Tax=Undibacterium arcticum TaxID=1762892 RepID=A0ABV7F728_9BURK